MVLFNYSTKELTAKVVYYGPGLCGKTTNLQWIHEKLPIKNKGKMLSLATETDRTLFFDFLPIELGTIRGMRTRIQLYTVPGQVFYNATRRMVLKGADCVVFVCDSQEAMLDANVESLENMRQNLEANEIDPAEIPMVFQYNKRDLPNALPIEILNEKLNPSGLPFYEAVAPKGMGVEETLKGATGLVFRSLASKYGSAEAPESPAARPAIGTPVPGVEPGTAASRVGSPTLPPLNLEAPPPEADALLDSLELEPAQEMAEDTGLAGVIGGNSGVDEAELDLDEAPSPPGRVDRRTGRPPIVFPTASEERSEELDIPTNPGFRLDMSREEADLDEIDHDALEEMDHEALEEIAEPDTDPLGAVSIPEAPVFEDETPPEPEAESSTSTPAPSAEPAPEPVDSVLERARLAEIEEDRVEAPLPRTAVETSQAMTPSVVAAPVSVHLPGTGLAGQTDVTIPIELSMGNGPAQINIHFRLTLNLKLQP